MNIRRARLDVDWAIAGPGIEAVAAAIDGVEGVAAGTVTITEIDLETVGTDVVVEGEGFELKALIAAIEESGAVVHSIDQLAFGDRIAEHVARSR
ncbi:MAG: hypothetical protein BGO11_16315 [Solirubrobacterales bacterium 70-9]|jgi:hypothetical protein|nr:MAG: hypothetical protein BGO11_16315 [Solirubrobacterales bacterium 70-9]